jgi:ParB family chromosome partitioning protein
VPLGKSLDNILDDYFGQTSVDLATNDDLMQTPQSSLNIQDIPVTQIKLSPYQTRTVFDQEKIQSLSQNIQEQGLIQPIIVIQKKVTSSTKREYVLLAGERRLRAIKLLKWDYIPALIKSEERLSEKQQAMLSAMENLQREDLSPIELSQTFRMLMLTQNINEQQLADMLGSSTQYVKNYLRLLTLSKNVKQALLDRKIGEGQARQLVTLDHDTQDKLLAKIIADELTVKEIKQEILNLTKPTKIKIKTVGHNLPQEYIQRADRFASAFPNSKIKCSGDEKNGKIVISWKS